METEGKDSKFEQRKLSKKRFRKSPTVPPEESPEQSNLLRKRKTASLSSLYPPPRPPLAIVTSTPDIKFNLTKLKGEIPARQRHCKCKESSCVKMYCWCFQSGKYCDGCSCSNCQNNVENEEVRNAALRFVLQRNQKVFRTMIISSPQCSQDVKDGRKNALILLKYIRCCCKRSQCVQGYCECRQANMFCSESCKCMDCKNFKRCEEINRSFKESKKWKDQQNLLDSIRKGQLNCTLTESWPIVRPASPGPLNFRFRSLLADVIQVQNLTEFCQLLMVTAEAVKALADQRNPLNLENPSHDLTVRNSAAELESQDKGPEDQGPKPDNHLNGIQHDMICKDSTSDAFSQKERAMSPGTLALMCDEKDMLFHPDASSDKILNCGCYSDVYMEQEKLVLAKFLDFLNSLITCGNAKESELSARAKRENGRENAIHNFVF